MFMWKHSGIRKTGQRHQIKGMECQDQIGYSMRAGRQAIALADGNGQTNHNADFGKTVTEYINDFLLTYYDYILEEDALTVSYNFFYHLQKMMDQKCKEQNIEKKELGSTILGACIDNESQSYCFIHLGDGMILGEKNNEDKIILSKPQNGQKQNETILSTAESAMKHLKVETGSLDNLKGILLTSDGLCDDPLFQEEILFSEKIKNDTMNPGIDDISVIRLQNI